MQALKFATLAALLTVGLGFACPAMAADEDFAPTGDALWDAYAPLLLDALEAGSPGEVPHVAPDELDALEAQFAGDPRYWQLRWWEGRSAGEPDELLSTAGPTRWLREAKQRGTVDAVTIWLLAERDEAELNRMWDLYGTADLPPEYAARIPQFKPEDTPEHWYEQQRFTAGDALVAALPDESIAWYRRAMLRFEYGDWEGALADLETGNATSSNRVLLPFPWSFVQQRLANDQPVGSELAAGIVIEFARQLPLPNFIRIKDHMKEQQMRWGMGAPLLSEAAPWHVYACRLGSMHGGTPVQWLVGYVVDNMVTSFFLLDTPESFDIDQRHELWRLHFVVRRVRDQAVELNRRPDPAAFVMDELRQDGYGDADLILALNALELIEGEHARLFGMADSILAQYPVVEPATVQKLQGSEVMRAVESAYYRWQYANMEPEQASAYQQVQANLSQAARFDFASVRQPEEPQPTAEMAAAAD